MTDLINFTKMRLNTVTRGTLRITRCAKCGRKGEYHRTEGNGVVIERWTHTASIIGGMVTSAVDECKIVSKQIPQ